MGRMGIADHAAALLAAWDQHQRPSEHRALVSQVVEAFPRLEDLYEALQSTGGLTRTTHGILHAWRCGHYPPATLHALGMTFWERGIAARSAQGALREAAFRKVGSAPYWTDYLTFLVNQGLVQAAMDAWYEAQEHLEDCQELHERFVWELANHAEINRAWQVWERLSPDYLEGREDLRLLQQALVSMEDSERYGCAPYDPKVPLEERWVRPRVLDSEHLGMPLIYWMPGCLVAVGGGEVVCKYVIPATDPSRRVLKMARHTLEEYQSWGGPMPRTEEDEPWLEIGVYGLDSTIVVRRADGEGRDPLQLLHEKLHPYHYAYLERWGRPTLYSEMLKLEREIAGG